MGTSRSTKSVRLPSEATPGKRDIAFDFISHNPKVARSNRAPATSYHSETQRACSNRAGPLLLTSNVNVVRIVVSNSAVFCSGGGRTWSIRNRLSTRSFPVGTTSISFVRNAVRRARSIYKGLDPSVPLIEITCPKCVSSGEWKLGGAGAGFHV